MKALSLALALAGIPALAGGLEGGTKLAEALALREEASFRQAFLALGPDEQAELIRVLTTEMRGWAILGKLPSRAEFDASTDERKVSFNSLSAWLSEPADPLNAFAHLRFVGLLHKPVELKLRYEKGGCVRPELTRTEWVALLVTKWGARVHDWLRPRWPSLARRMEPARRPAGATEPGCNRELIVALVADPGDGTRLREETIVRSDLRAFPAQLEGAAWLAFRRKVWEGAEILLASMSREESALPQRLRVIELVGAIDEKTFLRLRQTAILARAAISSR